MLASFSQAIYFGLKTQNLIGAWHGNLNLDPFWETENIKTNNRIAGVNTQSYLQSNSSARPINMNHESYQGYVFDLYFANNHSPLAGYGQNFIDACRKYGAPSDCTLMPALAKVETDTCKTGISAKQFNCWGFGGSGSHRIVYRSFPDAIDKITGQLMSGYGYNFFENAHIGALSYCGAHCGSYGNHVESEKSRLKDLMNQYNVKY
jgi:hypothetical protein